MKKQILFLLTAITLSWSANAQMVLEFNTNLSEGTTITLPLKGTVNVSVNWGDGSNDTYTAVGNYDHTYAAEGTYTVTITGSLTQFGNEFDATPNFDKLIKVTSFGDIGLTSLNGAFLGATNLEELPSALPPTVQNLNNMLSGSSKFNGNIGTWDVSNVTNMSLLFYNALVFNQDISDWDVSNVTQMNWMFAGTTAFNQNIGDWDVSNVTSMWSMFNGATAFNQDINTKVVNPGDPDEYIAWNVGNVTDMESMFRNASAFNHDISSWNVSNVTLMTYMFMEATAFNQNIGSWNVSNVFSMTLMFYGATSFNQNIGGWNVSKVIGMSSMFENATAFDQDISSWDVTSVINMTNMFRGVTLSTANYNNLLIGWAGKTVQNNVPFHGGNSKYSPGAAADARATLTGKGWTITDGGMSTSANLTIADNIGVYPNPTSGVVHFDFAGEKVQRIRIMDITGKTVFVKNNVQQLETVDLTGFANGLYIITLQTDMGNRSLKIIKQ